MSLFILLTMRLHMGWATLGFTKYVPFSLVEREHLYSNRQHTPNPDAQEPCE
jgi:hypothetical protein